MVCMNVFAIKLCQAAENVNEFDQWIDALSSLLTLWDTGPGFDQRTEGPLSSSKSLGSNEKGVHMPSRRLSILLILVVTFVTAALAQQNPDAAWKPVEDSLGRKGSIQPGDVYKFSMPRTDLKVAVAGTPIKAGLALGSWLAFKRSGNDAGVMGDLVLAESEVEPVMAKLEQEGIEQTALHN